MRSITNYDVYIFDCDGVILDTNELKITAMKETLIQVFGHHPKISECISFFRINFGISRSEIVSHFLDNIFKLKQLNIQKTKNSIINIYSKKCQKFYFDAPITDYFVEFIRSLSGDKFVASGSDQNELREVFNKRNISTLFNAIYGGPEHKEKLIEKVVKTYNFDTRFVLFGDSILDYESAVANRIDFIGYLPLSNTKFELQKICRENLFYTCNSWRDIK